MGITRDQLRRWSFRAAFGAVSAIAAVYVTPFATAWLQERGAFDHPSAKVESAMNWAAGIFSDPVWAWAMGGLLGIAIGFAIGVRADSLLARRELASPEAQGDQAILTERVEPIRQEVEPVAVEPEVSAADRRLNAGIEIEDLTKFQTYISQAITATEDNYKDIIERFQTITEFDESRKRNRSHMNLNTPRAHLDRMIAPFFQRVDMFYLEPQRRLGSPAPKRPGPEIYMAYRASREPADLSPADIITFRRVTAEWEAMKLYANDVLREIATRLAALEQVRRGTRT